MEILIQRDEKVVTTDEFLVLPSRSEIEGIRLEIDSLIVDLPKRNWRFYQNSSSYNWCEVPKDIPDNLPERHKKFLSEKNREGDVRIQVGTSGRRGWSWVAAVRGDARARFLISPNDLLIVLHEKRTYPGSWEKKALLRSDEWRTVSGLLAEAKRTIPLFQLPFVGVGPVPLK